MYLASTLGQLFSHDLEFSEEKGYLLFTLLFTMEAVGHVLGIKAVAGVAGASPGQVESKPCPVQITSMGGVTNTHIPCPC